MKWRILAILTILLAITIASPVTAQDGEGLSEEEQATLDIILAAFDNLDTFSSYRVAVSGEGRAQGELDFPDAEPFDQELSTEATLLFRPATDEQPRAIAIDSTQSGAVSFDGASQTTRSEFIIIGDTLYSRQFAPGGGDDVPWQTIQLGGDFEAQLVESLDLEDIGYIDVLLAGYLPSPVAMVNIESVTELEGEAVDGVETRVFEITGQPISAGALQTLANVLGADEEDALDSRQTLRVWIDVERNVPLQVEADVTFNLSVGEHRVEQETTATAIFSAFGETVDIAAPQLTDGSE
jgi:hypothetical protein